MLVKCIMFGKYIIMEKDIIGASKIKNLLIVYFFNIAISDFYLLIYSFIAPHKVVLLARALSWSEMQ